MKLKYISILTSILVIFLLFGYLPSAKSQTSKFWGTTFNGGHYNSGTLYSVDNDGENYALEYSVPVINSGIPMNGTEMCEYNGLLYGAIGGGDFGDGVLFEYNPVSGSYTIKHHFREDVDGLLPMGGLTLALNGKMYGITNDGGVYGNGVLFEYDPILDSLSVVFNFYSTYGRYPESGLIELAPGKMYGVTTQGGGNNDGLVYEYDYTTGVFTRKANFDETVTGKSPNCRLFADSSGLLYGTTTVGGQHGDGVLFVHDTSVLHVQNLHDFNYSFTGSSPVDGVMKASNGNLYGMTRFGIGYSYSGLIYEYSISQNLFTVKVNLDTVTGYKIPIGKLFELPNSKLIGTTRLGGASDSGNVFVFDFVQNSMVSLANFIGSTTGSFPNGTMTVHSNGNFYGVTAQGGTYNQGSLFEFNTSSTLISRKVEFHKRFEGGNVSGALCHASNGKLYGVTKYGGQFNKGVIFEFDKSTKVYTKVFDFSGDVNGAYPHHGLIEVSQGKLVGVLVYGGVNGLGTIFEFDYNSNTVNTFHYFGTGNSGTNPRGPLLLTSNKVLYGLASTGGSNGNGTLYTYNLNNGTYQDIIHFSGTNGIYPVGSLFESCSGKIYGSTVSGGVNTDGNLFEFDTVSNSLTFSIELGGVRGIYPLNGPSYENENGELFGVIGSGGAYNSGYIYKINPVTKSFTNVFDFNIGSNTGWNPEVIMAKSHENVLYGITRYGGADDGGVIFEYNVDTDIYTVKKELEIETGITVASSPLTLVTTCSADIVAADPTIIQNEFTLTVKEDGDFLYQWFTCDNHCAPIQDTGRTFVVQESGSYYVVISDGACSVKSECTTVLGVGIDKISSADNISIYPNPVSNTLKIELPDTDDYTVELFNTMGVKLKTTTSNYSNVIDVFMETYPEGMYMIRISIGETQRTFNVVKTR